MSNSTRLRTAFTCVPVLLVLVLTGCSSSDDPVAPVEDTRAPAAVTTLTAISGAAGSVTFLWTATGDDGDTGTAASYDFRYTPLAAELPPWSAWTEVQGEPAPRTAGQNESFTVSGLDEGETYAFALRVVDDEGLWSPSSNTTVATASPVIDTTTPAAVSDLDVWSANSSSVTLYWSATGDDLIYGTANAYDLRYAAAPITESSWGDATPVAASLLPTPAEAGTRETVTISGLVADTEHHFALKVVDERQHWSALSNDLAATTRRFRTWHIKADGSGDAPTIRAACIDSAVDGDVVLVAPGRYTWTNQGDYNIDFGMIYFHRDNPGVWLRSEAGPEATILDAEGRGRVIHITGLSQDYPAQMTIDGFTITGGNGNVTEDNGEGSGGGLQAHLCSPTIRNCVFRGNFAYYGGGLWYGGTGGPRIENCVFEENQAQLGGGALFVNSKHTTELVDCVFSNNEATEAGGGLFVANFKINVESCLFYENRSASLGGGIAFDTVDDEHRSMVTGCTVVYNEASHGGSGIRISEAISIVDLSRNIVAFNSGSSPFSFFPTPQVNMGCCDVFGNESGDTWPEFVVDQGGNFTADPQFCGVGDAEAYQLTTGSPCAPGNHPDAEDCGLIGALEVGCGR